MQGDMSYYAIVPNLNGLVAAVCTLSLGMMGTEIGTQEPYPQTLSSVNLSVVLPDMNPALQPVRPPRGPRDTALHPVPSAPA